MAELDYTRSSTIDPPQYTITELASMGVIPGRLGILDINNAGQVSGIAEVSGIANLRAVLWSQGQWVQLGTGAAEGTGTGGCLGSNVTGSSFAHAINDQGTVVGQADFGVLCVPVGSGFFSGIINDAAVFPLRTSASAGVSSAPGPGEIVAKIAWGINNLGQIVGTSPTGVPNEPHAVLWNPLPGPYPYPPMLPGMGGRLIALDPAGGVIGQDNMVDLGTLGGPNSAAFDINSSGKVVGYAQDATGENRAFIYDGTSMQALNPFPSGCASSPAFARAINDSDVVVGDVSCINGSFSSGTLAFVSDDTGIHILPNSLFGSPFQVVALDINNLDQIVGFVGHPPALAVLWQDGAMYDLESLIPPNSGWDNLDSAVAINDKGQIVGIGSRLAGPQTVFLLTPVSATDTTAPVLTVPADITTEATSPAGAAVTYTATATDDVDANPTVACSPPSGSTFAIVSTGVNCTATDASGNSANGSFVVTVLDTTPPVLTVPADITTDATSPAGAAVSYSVSAVDIADPAPAINCTPAAGTTFPIGSTAVNCTAADTTGNSANKGFQVIVKGAGAQITDLTADVTSLNLAQGFKNSLLTKLQNALNAANGGDLGTACGSLKAFVNQVSAQSGKKLTVNQANQLIAAANQIRAVLGCA